VPARKPRASAAAPAPTDLNPRREPALDFEDKDLERMTPADYAAIGFMCGLEVHQQLDTKSKLFCRCPSGHRMNRVDAEVLRHMRPTLSEMGEYDGTALMEFKTHKEIVYLVQRDLTCTYEIDDTPPFPIDEEAVRNSLSISKLFGLNLVSELQVMRKQYLDGSIPTGFQRTAMVGLGGSIPFRHSELGKDSELRIRQLTLEEDSCREVSDVGHRIVFRTDRLGMPLIETVTEPDMLTPRDVRTGGRLLAQVARASGLVRRGAGAARQDVNVSVAGSRRVEIKGVPSHTVLPLLVHNEAFRQLNLLRVKAELERRGVTKDVLSVGDADWVWDAALCVDAHSAVRATEYGPIREALERGHKVVAVRLPGFGGLLAHPTQPGLTFASELSERVRVIACLTGRPFMIASQLGDYGLTPGAWGQLRQALQAGSRSADDIVVVWGPEEDVDTAVREILIRAADALDGVPSETRQPMPDGTTGFERILPGPQRMYPDTDTPPLPIPDAWVRGDKLAGVRLPWDAEDDYQKRGLSETGAQRLVNAPWGPVFDALGPQSPTAARRLAAALEKRLVHHWRSTKTRKLPDADRLRPLVSAVDGETMRPEAFEAVFDRILEQPNETPESLVAAFSKAGDDDKRLTDAIAATVHDKQTVQSSEPEAVLRWAMGQAMPGLLGRIDPKTVQDQLIRALELSP
jgi:glutamyl-tRNA(Gln) amidotransferase subunit E